MSNQYTQAQVTAAILRLLAQQYATRGDVARDAGIASSGAISGSLGSVTVRYQPGGIAGGNTYTDFPSAVAALPPVDFHGMRSPSTMQIDDSFESPAPVPAGSYNVDSVRFVGTGNFNGNDGAATLAIASGVSFVAGNPGGVVWFENLSITFAGTAPLFEVPTGVELNVYMGAGTITCSTSTGPFISAAGFGWLFLTGPGSIGDGTNPVINGEALGTAQVNCMTPFVAIEANALTSTAAVGDQFLAYPLGALVHAPQGAGWVLSQQPATFAQPVQGTAALDLAYQEKVSAAVPIAAGAVLTPAQYACPMIPLTGVLAGNVIVTLPNQVGAVWDFDLQGLTLNSDTVSFTTGSGTAALVLADTLQAGQKGVRIGIAASNVVTRFS